MATAGLALVDEDEDAVGAPGVASVAPPGSGGLQVEAAVAARGGARSRR